MTLSLHKKHGETASDLHTRRELTTSVRNYHEQLDNQLDKKPNNQNEEYDCSMGLSNLLKSISMLARVKDDSRKVFDVIIINALTMVRNCYDTNKKEIEIQEAISKDINMLLKYIQIYFLDQKHTVEKPSIIVYLPEYRLPDKYMRQSNSIKDIRTQKLAKSVFGKKCTSEITPIELGSCTVYFMSAGLGNLPYKNISKVILSRCNSGVVKLMNRRYLLVSHCPLDFHLQNTLGDKLFLLESYTGALKSIHDFGKKVFKEDHIPFNQYTHLLLGDSVHVKPLVYRQDKKKVIEAAKKNIWDKKPLAVVLSDIRRLDIIPIDVITSIKF